MPARLDFEESRIDAIFAPLNQCHLPGAAVGIAINGRPVYRKGFGLASMELPVVLSPTIRMRIGSVTKHFASLACLLLCEDGRMGLDDPIGKYLPDLHPVTRGATLRSLMAHASGIRDVFDIVWQFNGTSQLVSSEQLLRMYRAIDDINVAPNTTWIYNNGAYLLLSTAIERATDRSLEEVFKERLFDPIGMSASLLHRWDGNFIANHATGHMTTPAGGFEKAWFFGTAFAGEGGIVSTVDDMLRWLAHMDAPTVGNRTTWDLLTTPVVLPNGTSTGYGFGLYRGEYRGVRTLSHSGGGMGANAQMLKVPEAGLDIIVMVNRGDVWATLLTEQILDACLPELAAVAAPRPEDVVSGVFRSKTTGRVVELFGVEGQQMASINGADLPLERGADGVLRASGMARFSKRSMRVVGPAGRAAGLEFNDYGNVDSLGVLERGSGAEIDAFVGRYRCDSISTDARVFVDERGTRLRAQGPFGAVELVLAAMGEGVWRARSEGYRYFGGVVAFKKPSIAGRLRGQEQKGSGSGEAGALEATGEARREGCALEVTGEARREGCALEVTGEARREGGALEAGGEARGEGGALVVGGEGAAGFEFSSDRTRRLVFRRVS